MGSLIFFYLKADQSTGHKTEFFTFSYLNALTIPRYIYI